jgi:hypothetical protein
VRIVRVVLILASFFGFIAACGAGLDSRYKRSDDRVMAFGIAGLMALNLFYVFWIPKPQDSKLRHLIGLWFEAKERELRMRGYPKDSSSA